MIKHIGIIACSYEGAALCYQTICDEGSNELGEHAHPEVSLHNIPLNEYMEFIREDNWDGVGRLMVLSAEKLAKAGADFLICPDNTIHQSFSYLKKRSSLPCLHIAEEVVKTAKEKKYKNIGILGTQYLMEGPVYPEKLTEQNLNYHIPDKADRIRINQIIFEELVYGLIKPESKGFFLSVIEELKIKGCDSVVLGCTEIPLIVLPEESPLPTLDSTRLLARAALKYAIEKDYF